MAHRLLPANTPLFRTRTTGDGGSGVSISVMSCTRSTRPRLRNSTGEVSRDDCLTNAQLLVRRSGPGSGPTRLQPEDPAPTTRSHFTAIQPSTPRNCGGGPSSRCDLAPQNTSFRTVALRERQHPAKTLQYGRQPQPPFGASSLPVMRPNSTVDLRVVLDTAPPYRFCRRAPESTTASLIWRKRTSTHSCCASDG